MSGTSGGRRLKHRIPARLRHHWKPVACLGLGMSALLGVWGDARMAPWVFSSTVVEADGITENITGDVDLYDTSTSHSIQLEYDQTEFDKMQKEFQDEGNKEYIRADLTIDGVYIQEVGIRLKGNSTLRALRGDRGAGGMQRPGGGRDAGRSANQKAGQADGNGARRAQGGPGGGGGGMTSYDLSFDKPEELPWLVKIDEYVEGRAYQGEREISLRPGSDEQVPYNEALALASTEETGQTAEEYAFTTVSANGSDKVTRLMVESPDTDYGEDTLGSNGILYKARAGGSFDYVGDDPTDYEKSFNQLNKKGSQDLAPVMKFIKWVDQASDKEFAEDLDQWVDVESLAQYVATQNLLLNGDDMAGPGNNYLLRYDLDTKKFTVLGWDYNLTFGPMGGDVGTGPDDDTGMGGGGGRQPPGGMEPPEGRQPPEGMEPPGGRGGDAAENDRKAGGGMRGGHKLKERFLETEAFDTVYKEQYRTLYEQIFASGFAEETLDAVEKQAQQAGVSAEQTESGLKALRKTVADRAAALAKDKEVGGAK